MTEAQPRQVPLRVVVVEDQALIRGSFELLVNAQDDMTVVATAADGRQALEVLGAHKADLVLMDIRMPVLDGITTITRLRSNPATKDLAVLVLTTFDDEALVLGALRAGANGFLLKDAAPQVLLEAARTVAQGGAWLDPAVTATVLAHLGDTAQDGATGTPASSQPTGAPPHASNQAGLREALTAREAQVLDLVCQGLSNAEIGKRVHIAPSTVKTHVKALLAKTGCANRVELIVHAYRHALVRPA